MNQNFRKIPELKYLYEINEDGVVRNVKSKHIMQSRINRGGYAQIVFHIKGEEITRTIHKLVADAFLKDNGLNPDGTKRTGIRTINHRDENKLNNNYKNLEYCDMRYNNSYGTRVSRGAETRTRKVYYIKDNEKICFDSAEQAAEMIKSTIHPNGNVHTIKCKIRDCASGKRKTAYKTKWYYDSI